MPLMSTVVLSASTQGLIVLIFVYSSFFELEFVCLFVVFVLFLGVDFLQKPIIEVSHYHKNPKLR